MKKLNLLLLNYFLLCVLVSCSNSNNDKQFTLFNNESGKSYQIPLIKSKDGPNVLDIRKLYQETGLFTFDPGFTSTASCESGITYIDGD